MSGDSVRHQKAEKFRVGSTPLPALGVFIESVDADSRPAEVLLEIVGIAGFDRPGAAHVDEDTPLPILKEVADDEFFVEQRVTLFFGEDTRAARRVSDLSLMVAQQFVQRTLFRHRHSGRGSRPGRGSFRTPGRENRHRENRPRE